MSKGDLKIYQVACNNASSKSESNGKLKYVIIKEELDWHGEKKIKVAVKGNKEFANKKDKSNYLLALQIESGAAEALREYLSEQLKVTDVDSAQALLSIFSVNDQFDFSSIIAETQEKKSEIKRESAASLLVSPESLLENRDSTKHEDASNKTKVNELAVATQEWTGILKDARQHHPGYDKEGELDKQLKLLQEQLEKLIADGEKAATANIGKAFKNLHYLNFLFSKENLRLAIRNVEALADKFSGREEYETLAGVEASLKTAWNQHNASNSSEGLVAMDSVLKTHDATIRDYFKFYNAEKVALNQQLVDLQQKIAEQYNDLDPSVQGYLDKSGLEEMILSIASGISIDRLTNLRARIEEVSQDFSVQYTLAKSVLDKHSQNYTETVNKIISIREHLKQGNNELGKFNLYLNRSEEKANQLLKGIAGHFFSNISQKKQAILHSLSEKRGVIQKLDIILKVPGIPVKENLETIKDQLTEIKVNLSDENLSILRKARGLTLFGLRKVTTTSDKVALEVKEAATALEAKVDDLMNQVSIANRG
ncbi:MAG: hypothetical protein V4471_07640 [Pseudomonadota bacterium]